MFKHLLLIALSIFLLSACGSGSGTGSSSTGAVSFDVKWDQQSAESVKSAIRASSDVCSDYGIETIHASVFNSSNSEIASMDWTCSAHSGSITNVPVGSNYTVYLQGLDSSGTITWQGSVTGISVTANTTASAGTITMTYIGSDSTPPYIVSFDPLQDATDVPVTTTITATFNENIAPSTINTDTFTLFDYGTNSYISGSVTYDSSTMTATFTPSANLSYGTMYMANMQAGSDGVLDYKGWGIIGTSYVQFTTEDAPTSAPSAPTGVSAAAGDSEVEISWTAATGATSYNIYYSTTSGVTKTNGTKISSVTSPSTHSSLTNDTTYYYVVTAVNSYGESGESSQVSATPAALGTAPSAPTGVSATAGDSQVEINWTAVTGATSYNIYYSTTSGVSKTTGTKISSVTSPYTHTSLTNDTTYYYVVTAVNGYGESGESNQVATTPQAATGRMPDTNQTTSYTSTFGEDHDYTINPPSYTDNGDGTITDNVTGLIWQKQDDATTRPWDDAGAYCDASTLGGYSDWRLPSRIELVSIVDNGVYNPSINTTFFPGTSSSFYWSSTTNAYGYASYAWYVYFYDGYSSYYLKTNSYYVRCVRGGQTSQSLTDNSNGTVTDSALLTWQQAENSTMTWEAALTYCEGLSLAGNTDWRLPNHKELLSLVDDTRYNPSINTTFFPGTYSSIYWSSTTIASYPSEAWGVVFDYGYSYSSLHKETPSFVRCVRGGQ